MESSAPVFTQKLSELKPLVSKYIELVNKNTHIKPTKKKVAYRLLVQNIEELTLLLSSFESKLNKTLFSSRENMVEALTIYKACYEWIYHIEQLLKYDFPEIFSKNKSELERLVKFRGSMVTHLQRKAKMQGGAMSWNPDDLGGVNFQLAPTLWETTESAEVGNVYKKCARYLPKSYKNNDSPTMQLVYMYMFYDKLSRKLKEEVSYLLKVYGTWPDTPNRLINFISDLVKEILNNSIYVSIYEE